MQAAAKEDLQCIGTVLCTAPRTGLFYASASSDNQNCELVLYDATLSLFMKGTVSQLMLTTD